MSQRQTLTLVMITITMRAIVPPRLRMAAVTTRPVPTVAVTAAAQVVTAVEVAATNPSFNQQNPFATSRAGFIV